MAVINYRELGRRACRDGFDHTGAKLHVVVTVSRELVSQRLIGRDDSHIDKEHVAEAVKASLQLVERSSQSVGNEPVVK